MPIILGIFALIPLCLGIIVQFVVQTFLKKKLWWVMPPVLVVVVSAIVVGVRVHAWTSVSVSPITQLLFVPGLPALFALIGLGIGHKMQNKFWAWWNPRIIP